MFESDIDKDMAGTMAEISSRGSEAAGSAPPPGSAGGESPAAVSQTPSPAPDPWRTPPKSWKKDYHQHWERFDPKVMQYIHQREKEALEGIMQYKTVADKWDSTLKPYQQWLEAQGMDPHEVVSRLATSHIILKHGSPEDKRKWALQLIQDYDLQDILSGNQAPSRDIEILRSELNSIRKDLYERQFQENLSLVNSFFAEPKNEFAEELKEDILALLEKGAASTLQEAYEKAMWLNPSVRGKLMQREIENTTKPKRSSPTNLKSSSAMPPPTEEAEESLEDTMKATLARINSR